MHWHHYAGFSGGWLLCGLLAAWMASTKGRSGCFWALVCIPTGLVGLIVVALLPAADD